MVWLLWLLLSGAFLMLRLSSKKDSSRIISCNSCDEFTDYTCKKKSGFCVSKYPDYACQTKDIYTQHHTGEYVYQYSILGCPKRCVEYTRITNWDKTVFFCCNESYCNTKRSPGFIHLEDLY